MKTFLAAALLAGVAWGCDARAESRVQDSKAAEQTYTATVKIDDV